jgi:transcriptional regulator with XRE-family HTH domain
MRQTDGERLLELIKRLKITRLQVAEYLGVSERTVYRWQYENVRVPRMAFIALELLLQAEV